MTNLTSIALITTSYLRLFISDLRVYKKNVFLNSSSFRHVFLFFWGGGCYNNMEKTDWGIHYDELQGYLLNQIKISIRFKKYEIDQSL